MRKILPVLALAAYLPAGAQLNVFRSPHQEGYASDMQVVHNASGEMTILANTYAWGEGGSEVLLFQLEADGDMIWQKCYGNIEGNFPNSIDTLEGGDYIVAGHSGSVEDVMVLRIDAAGDTVWTRRLSTAEGDVAWDVKRLDNTSFLVCGHTGGVSDPLKMFLTKIDNNGNVIWSKLFEGGNHFIATNMLLLGGYVYMLGGSTTYSSVGLIKLDSNGNIKWQYRYAYPDSHIHTWSIKGFSNSDLLISGYHIDTVHSGDPKSFYTRLDSSGNIVWAKKLLRDTGAFKIAIASHVALDANEDILASGFFIDSTTFAPKPQQMLCLKIDQSTGDTLWTQLYNPGTHSTIHHAIATTDSIVWLGYTDHPDASPIFNNSSEPVIFKTDLNGYSSCHGGNGSLLYGDMDWIKTPASFYTVPFVFDEIPAHFTVGTPAMYDSLACNINGIYELQEKDCLELYPNPGQGNFNIRSCENILQVMVYDMNGRCVYNHHIHQSVAEWNGAVTAKGMYAVVIETTKGRYTKKLVVE